ncbi:MAG: aminoglycoside phosphotransferase family protein [Candidatus Kaistia colombiensis]|nr:MAG: aminoglycoside phosphotransferase family protein [Kaistia sp.]
MVELHDLDPILAELELPPALSSTPLPGGSNEVFLIDLRDGAIVVLKISRMQETMPTRDAHAAALLAPLGIPVTRYLLIDESRNRLPFRFALTSYLPGLAAIDCAAHPNYRDIFREIGGLARRLHTIELPAFGTFPEPRHGRNTDYVRALADQAFARFLHYGADPALTEKLQRIFERDFDAVVPATRQAVFAHDDLHPGNILVVATGARLSISGLVDFGNARASAAVMDLAKTVFICEHMAPGSSSAILAGYGPIDHPAPQAALAFYTMLHRVVMWWWLRHIGAIAAPETESDLIEALRATAAQT